ncbi:hypothetical protein E2320_002789 [Naja naja]|nr:hypothetical protein E2320_002789 [Naja naja]
MDERKTWLAHGWQSKTKQNKKAERPWNWPNKINDIHELSPLPFNHSCGFTFTWWIPIYLKLLSLLSKWQLMTLEDFECSPKNIRCSFSAFPLEKQIPKSSIYHSLVFVSRGKDEYRHYVIFGFGEEQEEVEENTPGPCADVPKRSLNDFLKKYFRISRAYILIEKENEKIHFGGKPNQNPDILEIQWMSQSNLLCIA